MNVLETYYTYAKLSQAAYIDLSPSMIGTDNPFSNVRIAKAADDQERVPKTLAENNDTHLDALQESDAYTALAGSAQLTILADRAKANIASLAQQDNATGLATRYALKELNPFALISPCDYSHLLKTRRWRRPEGSAKQSGRYLQMRESGVEGRAA